MKQLRTVASFVVAAAVPCLLHGSTQNRLIMASQSDFANHLGFYASFENIDSAGNPLQLKNLVAVLAVGDGANWHFLTSPANFKIGDRITYSGTITATSATFSLNGKIVSTQSATLSPQYGPITGPNIPAWASDPTPYVLHDRSLTISISSPVKTLTWSSPTGSDTLQLFEQPEPPVWTASIKQGSTVKITAVIDVTAPVDLHKSAPFIDPFGQVIAASFPNKVTKIADLAASIQDENNHTSTWKRPTTWDAFGGAIDAGWTVKPTGFYAVTKHSGAWYFVSPKGNPLFYTGICDAPAPLWDVTPLKGREYLWKSLPPNSGVTAQLYRNDPWGTNGGTYFAQQSNNLITKFGTNFQAAATTESKNRIEKWGFTGIGKWATVIPGLPDQQVLGVAAPRIAGLIDIFDLKSQVAIVASLKPQITPRKSDPFLLGWSIGNEYDEIVTAQKVHDFINTSGTFPGKTALLKAVNLLDPSKATDAQIETMRQLFAKNYYQTLYKSVKQIDPNHLYMGFWIVPGWWQNDTDWNLITPYCDVIGYDRYASTFSGIEYLLSRSDKPVLLGEFSYPQYYNGLRGFGRFGPISVETELQAGQSYASLLSAATIESHCVGAMWFQYRDEPLTGRGPGNTDSLVLGEHYAFGLVDGTDRPKWDLVDKVHAANIVATKNRLGRFK